MSFEQNRVDLIENLTKAFKVSVITANMQKMHDNAGVKTLIQTNNGVDVVLSLQATAIFKPVITDENYAKISFDIIFKNCIFNKSTQGFDWDGSTFSVDYDFEYNLMFCRISNEAEYNEPKWVLQDFEQNFTKEKKVGISVLNNVFGAMTKKEFEEFGRAAFKIACNAS